MGNAVHLNPGPMLALPVFWVGNTCFRVTVPRFGADTILLSTGGTGGKFKFSNKYNNQGFGLANNESLS